VFVEEREAIAIEALFRSGNRGGAQRRAQAFSRSFPASAYQRRIAAVLSGP
jgi:hypothetical protein